MTGGDPPVNETQENAMTRTPVNVTVTGAAGQIGYALLFRIASGAAARPGHARSSCGCSRSRRR